MLRVSYLLVGGFGFTTSSVMATLAALMAFLRLVRLCFFVGFGNRVRHLLSVFLSFQFLACFFGF